MQEEQSYLETGSNEFEIIEFYIDEVGGGESLETTYFGVNVAKVVEVVSAPEGLESSEAAAHPSYLGIIPLRDLVLPVIDLSIWLGIERQESEHELIIVTEFNKRKLGFLVSGVTQIHRISWSEVKEPNRCLSNVPSNCVTGTVQVEEKFILLLDMEKALQELDSTFESEMEEGEIAISETKYKALIVDDSAAIRMMIVKRFEDANFEPIPFVNGEQAWDWLSETKQRVENENRPLSDFLDIVVADIEMPQMDGYSLTKHIKGDPVLKKLPVILFSSMISDMLKHKGEEVGADDQITKPEFNELSKRSLALLEK